MKTDTPDSSLLLQFLVENDLLNKFLTALKQQSKDERARYEDIDRAFNWLESDEGHAFWKNINNDWCQYRENHKIRRPRIKLSF